MLPWCAPHFCQKTERDKETTPTLSATASAHANGAPHAGLMAEQAMTTRGSLRRGDWGTAQGPGKKPMEDGPCSTGHSPRRQNSGPHTHTNEASYTGTTADPRRNLQREEQVTVQGPVRKPTKDETHRRGGGRGTTRCLGVQPISAKGRNGGELAPTKCLHVAWSQRGSSSGHFYE